MIRKVIPFVIITVFLLSGCSIEELKNDILGLKQDVEEKVDNVKNEVDRISDKVTETKDAIEDKYEKGKKVIEAVDDFIGSEEENPESAEKTEAGGVNTESNN